MGFFGTMRTEGLEPGWTEYDTWFLNQCNDGIGIYVHKEGDKYILTDAGDVDSEFFLNGMRCLWETKRKEIARILKRFDVTFKDCELIKECTPKNDMDLEVAQCELIQAQILLFWLLEEEREKPAPDEKVTKIPKGIKAKLDKKAFAAGSADEQGDGGRAEE